MAKPIMWLLFVASTSIYLVDGSNRQAAADDGPSFDQEASDNKYNVNNDPDMNQENIKEVLLHHGPILVGSAIEPGVKENKAKKLPLAVPEHKKEKSKVLKSTTISSSSTTTSVKASSAIPLTTSSQSVELSSTTISSISSVASSTVSIKSSPIASSVAALACTVKAHSVPLSSSTSKAVVSSSTVSPVAPASTPSTPSTSSQPIKPSSTSTTPFNKKVESLSKKELMDIKAYIESMMGRWKRSPKGASFIQKSNSNKNNTNNSPRMAQENVKTKNLRDRRSPKGPTFNQKSNKNKNNVNNSPRMNQSNVNTKIHDHHPIVPGQISGPVAGLLGRSKKSKKVVKRSPAKGASFIQKANRNENNLNNRPKMNQSNVDVKIDDHHPIIPVAGSNSKKLKKKQSKVKAKRDEQSRRFFKPPPYRGDWNTGY